MPAQTLQLLSDNCIAASLTRRLSGVVVADWALSQ